MKKLYKCKVCGYISEGEFAPEKCPKCGVGAENFQELTKEEAEKIYRSEKTNNIHMEIVTLANKIIALSEEGIKDNLDPKCAAAFEQTKNELWVVKQRIKAELAGHMNLGKW